jgi:cytochrome o ubiquinol oxidase subunit 2
MSISNFMTSLRATIPWRVLTFVLAAGLLAGCGDIPVIQTKGWVADQQRDLMFTSLLLMLIVVVPVIILTLFFTFRYRATNEKAKYDPDWDHSTKLELIWWGVPIVIIVILASITWRTSHDLDPYKQLEVKAKPIEIQVVALPWKWLFLYPEQGIAVVNHVRFPVDVPVNFKITAQAPMNSFWIPHLAGQIYAMEGMQTKLSVIADEAGDFPGYSSNFSGEGHNGMKFIARATTLDEFKGWVDSVKAAKGDLTRSAYDSLAKPSLNEPVRTWSLFQPGIFLDIMMSYMLPPGSAPGTKPDCHGMTDSDSMGAMLDCPRMKGGDSAKAMLDCPRMKGGDSAKAMLDCPRMKGGDSTKAMLDCPRMKAAAKPMPSTHSGHGVDGHHGHHGH